MSVTVVCCRIGGIISPFAAVNLVQQGHGAAAATAFAATAAAAAVAIAFVPRDTSGKALADSVAEIGDVEHQQQREQEQEDSQRRRM
jgi:hypothetical protein